MESSINIHEKIFFSHLPKAVPIKIYKLKTYINPLQTFPLISIKRPFTLKPIYQRHVNHSYLVPSSELIAKGKTWKAPQVQNGSFQPFTARKVNDLSGPVRLWICPGSPTKNERSPMVSGAIDREGSRKLTRTARATWFSAPPSAARLSPA